MQSFPRALSSLGRSNAAWTCSACTKALRQPSKTGFFNSSMSRKISNTSKPRQNVAPTMEQLREPFKKKNSSTMYYTLSIILGTVAFSYGSVPMYKMVCCRRQSPAYRTATKYSSRSVKQQAGEASPSKLPVMVVPMAGIPLSASNPLLLQSAYALPSTGPSRMSCLGNLCPNNARSKYFLVKRLSPSTQLQIKARRISLAWRPTVSPLAR